MKIGLITTINTNIGDDFIREGILHALKHAKPGTDFDFIMINKHDPYNLYPKWHPVYWTKLIPKKRHLFSRIISRISSWAGGSVFNKCDAIIQCGAPVYWYNCNKVEWAEVFWNGVALRLSHKIPILNIAAGSCYPWENVPNTVECKADAKYMKFIFDICSKTIVRDSKSQQLLKSLGVSPVTLPCSALLASMPYGNLEQTEEFVFINYMVGGSHYDFGQNINSEKWEFTMKSFVHIASKSYQLAFICHNQDEFDAAKKIAPNIRRFLPRTVKEYFELAVRGKVGIFNRMHASVSFAGLGIPSIAIGADTRMLMVNDIGLQTYYVKDVTVDLLKMELDKLIENKLTEKARLKHLQNESFDRYIEELKKI